MEILDLYDKDLNLTGKTMVRGEQIPENCFIRIVVVFIQNDKGEFLIQKTSKVKGNKFASTGGHFKSGDDSITTIQTEVFEELGVLIDKDKFLFLNTFYKNNVVFDVYYLNLNIEIESLKLQTEEVESATWFSKAEIEKFIEEGVFSPSHSQIYEKYIKGKF